MDYNRFKGVDNKKKTKATVTTPSEESKIDKDQEELDKEFLAM